MRKEPAKQLVLGFITVAATPDRLAFRGGYLLTTDFGRPIEFHYTSELRVAKQHRILFGPAFEEHVFSEILGKPMTDRQLIAPRIIVVDHRAMLRVRTLIPAPLVLVAASDDQPEKPLHQPAAQVNASVLANDDQTTSELGLTARPIKADCHPDFPQDLVAFEKLRPLVAANFDWLEPFERIKIALAEIRDPSLAAA